MYFKKYKKNKKNIKLNTYILCILISIFISLIHLNVNVKRLSKKDHHLTQHSKNENLLPPKPKEKWKYIKKLENL
ncbi:hypothetical protein [Buchnera aphidicola]|uniref:hypothetical protein n=1 Tax=Buchnera aphidicola TaxID=9 RepID=UPI0034640BCA